MSYTPVQNRFWSDGWVRGLNALDRYLFLYLLTNGRAGLTGIYELPLDLMGAESGIDEKDLRLSMLIRLEPKVYYKEGWVIMVNFLKHKVSNSPDYLRGIRKSFDQLPAHIQEISRKCGYDVDTLPRPSPDQGTIDKIRRDKINTHASRDFALVEESELSEGKTPKKPKDPFLLSASKVWHGKCKDEFGREPSGGLTKTMKIIGGARKSLTDDQIKEKMMDWFKEGGLEEHEMMQITRCFSPFQIDKYLASL